MKCIITYPGGSTTLDDVELGDPSVADELDCLAHLKVQVKSITFVEETHLSLPMHP